MNSKERILTVMRGDALPDRVPVCIGITEGYPVRFTTGDYLEFFHYNPEVPLWKAHADTERRFGSDSFIDFVPDVKDEFRMEEKRLLEEKNDYIIYEKILHTPEGELFSKQRLGRHEGFHDIEPYIKDLKADFPKLPYLMPDPENLDFDKYMDAYNYVGDDGSMGPYIMFPLDWLSRYIGGPENMIMAVFDSPGLFEEFAGIYTEWCISFLDEFVKRNIPMDVVPMSAACHSYSVTSPDFFDRFGIPFLSRMLEFEKLHKDKFLLDQHTCGRSRGVLEKSYELGVRAFEPLEEAPMGDVNIAEAKDKFGKTMTLKGNINSIETMYKGTPEIVREDVKRKLEIAMPGGRYFCAVGDQIPYDTPVENVEALVETVLEYGSYV